MRVVKLYVKKVRRRLSAIGCHPLRSSPTLLYFYSTLILLSNSLHAAQSRHPAARYGGARRGSARTRASRSAGGVGRSQCDEPHAAAGGRAGRAGRAERARRQGPAGGGRAASREARARGRRDPAGRRLHGESVHS